MTSYCFFPMTLGQGFGAFIIGKMSKKTRNLDKSYQGFSEFRIGNFFSFLQYLNGLFFLRCHFMLMFGCKVIHFSSPFCFQMIKFYALAIQCLLKYTIQKSMHYFPFLLITSCSFLPLQPLPLWYVEASDLNRCLCVLVFVAIEN